MTDIVERLRSEGALAGHYDAPAIQREAADEIEWLRAERDRLAKDLAKSHKDILPWIETATQLEAAVTHARAAK